MSPWALPTALLPVSVLGGTGMALVSSGVVQGRGVQAQVLSAAAGWWPGHSRLHTVASASEAAQTQWLFSSGKVLALAACVTLVLCSSHAELSNGPITPPSTSPFHSEQSKRITSFSVLVNGTASFAV